MARPAGLQLVVERTTYAVAGSDAASLRAVIEAVGPSRAGRGFAAFTDWEVTWGYAVAPAAAGVRLAGARLAVRATILAPRWRGLRSTPPSLCAAWQRYVAAIEAHEQGHVNFAMEAGRAVLSRLEGLAPFPDTEALRRAVDAAANEEVAAVRERERLYDEVSDHGATQGVVL